MSKRSRSIQWYTRLASALLFAALCAPSAAQALTLSLTPLGGGSVVQGQSVTVVVGYSGLTAGSAQSLTAFELDVLYDEVLLDFTGLTWGTQLGDPTCTLIDLGPGCEALAEFSTGSGIVELGESTLLDAATINAAQAASGVVATLQFTAVMVGNSSLDFGQLVASGTISGTTEDTLVANGVGSSLAITPVPEPASASLVVLGLAAMALRRGKQPA